jgi:hypothetical protein
MWPKMLFELLPHFARLLPMADKYLTTRSASEKAQQAALTALAEDVRAELGKGTEAQAGLSRHIEEQSARVGALAADVTRTRIGVGSVEARLEKLEKTAAYTARLVSLAVVFLAMVLALLGVVVWRVIR